LGFDGVSRVKIYSAANDNTYMRGAVTSYSETTLVVNVDTVGNSGTTAADWIISEEWSKGATWYETNGSSGTNTLHMENTSYALYDYVSIVSKGYNTYTRGVLIGVDKPNVGISGNLNLLATASDAYLQTDVPMCISDGTLYAPSYTLDVRGTFYVSGDTTIGGLTYFSNDIEFVNELDGVIYKSGNGKRWRHRIDNDGLVVVTELV
jgi:hypothetical protein